MVDAMVRGQASVTGSQSFEFLAPIAEPNPHDFFIQVQGFSQEGNVLRHGFWLSKEVGLEFIFDVCFDARSFLPFSRLTEISFVTVAASVVERGFITFVSRRTTGNDTGAVCFLEPLAEERLEFAHVLETQLEGFKSADCGLRKNVSVVSSKCQADISLCKAHLDSPLFELTCEHFQLLGGCRLLDSQSFPGDVFHLEVL